MLTVWTEKEMIVVCERYLQLSRTVVNFVDKIFTIVNFLTSSRVISP